MASELERIAKTLAGAKERRDQLSQARDRRDKALEALDSPEAKEKHKPEYLTGEKTRLRLSALNEARPIVAELKDSIRAVAGRARAFDRLPVMRGHRFYELPKSQAVTEQEKQARRQLEETAGLRDEIRGLRWAIVLPRMSVEQLLNEARSTDSPRILASLRDEFYSRPVEQRRVESQVELENMLDAAPLPEHDQAQQVFQQVEELARQVELLEADLVWGDNQAPKIMNDEELVRQFHQRNQ